jgi:paraquat-inducible protein A
LHFHVARTPTVQRKLVETIGRHTIPTMSHDPIGKIRGALQRTATPVMLGCAFALFFAGVAVPFFSVTRLWVFHDAVSVLSGLVELARANEWFLFAIIFLFTLVFPLIKLGVLTAVWWFRSEDEARADRLLTWESSLAKWSMLDVFVVAILIVAMKSASVAQIRVGVGIYLFTASVILTQLISIRLGRRLRRRREVA